MRCLMTQHLLTYEELLMYDEYMKQGPILISLSNHNQVQPNKLRCQISRYSASESRTAGQTKDSDIEGQKQWLASFDKIVIGCVFDIVIDRNFGLIEGGGRGRATTAAKLLRGEHLTQPDTINYLK